MKYKIRPFKYGPYDYRDGESFLNKMSQKGWEFKTTSKGFLRNWAMFEKSKDERKSTYNIDLKANMTDDEKEEYYKFYSDLGWDYQDTYDKKLNIFRTDKKNNIPIYSEGQIEYENLKEYMKPSKDVFSLIFCFMITCLIYINFNLIGMSRYLIVTYGVIILLTMGLINPVVILCLNMIYRSKCKKSMETTGQLPENVLLKKWRVWEFYGENLIVLLIGLIPIWGFGYEIWGKGLIPRSEVLLFGKEFHFVIALVGFLGMLLINYIYMIRPEQKVLRIIDFLFDFSILYVFYTYLIYAN